MKFYKDAVSATFHNLFMIGYTMHTVPAEVMTQLKKEINQLTNTNFESAIPYNYTLAGAIEKEYRLIESAKVIDEYIQTTNLYRSRQAVGLVVQQVEMVNSLFA